MSASIMTNVKIICHDGGMTEQTPDTTNPGQPPDTTRRADILRYIPPVTALGTAFVLQTILVTDTVGTALAHRYPDTASWPWYLTAALLGVSVASCVEGGAAYLLDLYDKHLLARDSVWVLRLAMVAYVSASAAAIHWWTGERHLPSEVGWMLAGMSASALFLWSRGSRWRYRVQMRAAGQLDVSMPRLSVAAKVMHPVRWLITLYLVSWEPVSTTAEARARYEQWRTGPHWWTRGQRRTVTTAAHSIRRDVQVASADSTVVPIRSAGSRRKPVSRTADSGAGPATIEQLADTLREHHGDRPLGRPTASEILRQVYGSCATDRALAAKDLHNERVNRGHATSTTDGPDDPKRAPVEVVS